MDVKYLHDEIIRTVTVCNFSSFFDKIRWKSIEQLRNSHCAATLRMDMNVERMWRTCFFFKFCTFSDKKMIASNGL